MDSSDLVQGLLSEEPTASDEDRQQAATMAALQDTPTHHTSSSSHVSACFLAASATATLPMFLFGFNTGALNAPEAVIFPEHSTFVWSLAVSAFCVGGLAGAYGAGRWNGGRVSGLMAIFYISLISGVLHCLAPNMIVLIVGRLGVGLAGGAATVLTPMYLSEISPPDIRGSVGTLTQLSCVMGILASVLWESPFESVEKWRWIFLPVPVVAALGVMLSRYVLVESPSWLLMNNSVERRQEAIDNIRRLRGLNREDHESDDESIIEMILQTNGGTDAGNQPQSSEDLSLLVDGTTAENDQTDEDQEPSDDHELSDDAEAPDALQQQSVSSVYPLFRSYALDPKNRIPLVSSVLFPVAQQLSGINAVFYYSTALFHGVIDDPRNGTILAFTVNAVVTVLAVLVMDRFGRRILLSVSAGGMFACCILLTFSLRGSLPGIVTIVGVMMYITFFELGLGCIPFFLATEMIEPEFLGKVQSISMSFNWFSNFCVGLFFPYMVRFLGPYAFVPFAVVLLSTVLYSIFVLPETRGKSPSQVMEELVRRNGHQPLSSSDAEFSNAFENRLV